MEIDLTSVIIGIAALSTFFIPIGIHQFSQKYKFKKTRKSFDDAAKVYDLHIDDMEILRNGFAIGINTQQHCILHLNNQKESIIELDDVQNCKLFKDLCSEIADNGTKIHTVRMGIHIKFKHNRSLEIKLPLFEGKEGSIFGDEEVTIHRWIYKIHSVLKESIK
jgi:hypothetical protein